MNPRHAGRPPGFWIPWIFFGFFGVVLVANGTMIWVAIATWGGTATQGAYEKGLDYNRNLAAAQRQAELGWHVDLEAQAIDRHRLRVDVSVDDGAEVPLDGAAVAVLFERPSNAADDVAMALEERQPGLYGTVIERPSAGLWNAHVTVRLGDAVLVRDERLILRQ